MKILANVAAVLAVTVPAAALAAPMNSGQKAFLDRKIAQVTKAHCVMGYDYDSQPVKNGMVYYDSTLKNIPAKKFVDIGYADFMNQMKVDGLTADGGKEKNGFWILANGDKVAFLYFRNATTKMEIYRCIAQF